MIRAFLGLDLPEDLKEKIEALKTQHQLFNLPIKLVEKHNSHIALKFFGELSEDQIKLTIDSISKIITSADFPIKIKIDNILVFPNFFRPRVLALKVISPELEQLAKNLFSEFNKLKFIVPENRIYRPHITLGRIKEQLIEKEIVKIKELKFSDSSEAKTIQLFSSRLLDEGPIYDILKSFPENND